MGLMRTDPPFLRRENKVLKEKNRARNQKRETKSGDDFKKKCERLEEEKKIMDNDHSLRQIFHLLC